MAAFLKIPAHGPIFFFHNDIFILIASRPIAIQNLHLMCDTFTVKSILSALQ